MTTFGDEEPRPIVTRNGSEGAHCGLNADGAVLGGSEPSPQSRIRRQSFVRAQTLDQPDDTIA
jgi:hypothetical protein